MSVRHLALAATALVVLAMGVYLFVEVRATPAQAQAAGPVSRPLATGSEPSAPPQATPSTRATPTAATSPDTGARPPVRLGSDSVDITADDPTRANPKLDSLMDQANKAYDRQDFEEARAIAGKLLSKDPTNVRMLRIMVSSSCIEGDSVTAQKYFEQLPKFDREQMKQRCDRYGVTFKDTPQ